MGLGSGDTTLEPPPRRRRAARWMARAARVCRRASSNHVAAVPLSRCGTACGLDGASRFLCRSSRRRAAAARACALTLARSRLAAVAAAALELPEFARSALLSREHDVVAVLESEGAVVEEEEAVEAGGAVEEEGAVAVEEEGEEAVW